MTVAATRDSVIALEPDLQDSFYRSIYDILNEKTLSASEMDAIQNFTSNHDFNNPISHVEGFRKLLALSILFQLNTNPSKQLYDLKENLQEKVFQVNTWSEFQLITAYKSLCEELSEVTVKNTIIPHTQSDGFASIEYGNHWTWGEVPLQPYHIELGIIWALYGHHTNQLALKSSAHEIANFQLNLLDDNYLPLQGVFTQEKDAGFHGLVAWSSVLYHCVGHSYQKPELVSISETQKKFLKKTNQKVHPVLPLILKWKPFGTQLSHPRKPSLPKTFKCPALGACSHRTDDSISISTVYGGRTGLGTYQVNHDLSIVTFGPQYKPYGDCQGFGVESTARQQGKFSSLSIEEKKDGYLLKGYTKVAGKTIHKSPYAVWGNSNHSEVWLDVKQEVSLNTYHLLVNYLSYPLEEPLSFVFYIKANECEIKGAQSLQPKSLDRYKGEVQQLTFSSNSLAISVNPSCENGEMEVIPLAGDDSFWGCDFLVGFSVSPDTVSHSWKIDFQTL